MEDVEMTTGELGRWLQRIESKLDRAIDDHERRLRSVERWMYAMPPTLILASASVVISLWGGG
jgi:hypothetical protein